MDENETELVRQLFTRIAMNMEDASVIAINLGGPSSRLDPAQIEELSKSVAAISKLMEAAQSISE